MHNVPQKKRFKFCLANIVRDLWHIVREQCSLEMSKRVVWRTVFANFWQTCSEYCFINEPLKVVWRVLFTNFGKLFTNIVCQTRFGEHRTIFICTFMRFIMMTYEFQEKLVEELRLGVEYTLSSILFTHIVVHKSHQNTPINGTLCRICKWARRRIFDWYIGVW